MILPVTNYERPCNEQVNAFVYCEIDPATFKGELHVHVIEQTPVTFIKRVVTWSDRNARRNFYFKEWCDSEKTFYSSFFSCVTINHLHPIDPMYFRNNPTELDTFLEETRRLRSISDDTGGEGSKWYVLFDSIIRNLCAMSLTKKVDTRNENRLNLGRNSDFSTKVEIFAATEKEIAMYANDEHNKEIPLMFWFGKDTSKDTDREPYFSSPIAEPIEEKPDTTRENINETLEDIKKTYKDRFEIREDKETKGATLTGCQKNDKYKIKEKAWEHIRKLLQNKAFDKSTAIPLPSRPWSGVRRCKNEKGIIEFKAVFIKKVEGRPVKWWITKDKKPGGTAVSLS